MLRRIYLFIEMTESYKKKGQVEDFTDYIIAAILLFFVLLFLASLHAKESQKLQDLDYGRFKEEVYGKLFFINYLRSSVTLDNGKVMTMGELIVYNYNSNNKFSNILKDKTKEFLRKAKELDGNELPWFFTVEYYIDGKKVEDSSFNVIEGKFPSTEAYVEVQYKLPLSVNSKDYVLVNYRRMFEEQPIGAP